MLVKTAMTQIFKKLPKAEKIIFFEIFLAVAHLHIQTKLFCYYQNFISSAFQRNHGGDKIALRQRTTKNDKQRTTNTTDDHNSPSGFSESLG